MVEDGGYYIAAKPLLSIIQTAAKEEEEGEKIENMRLSSFVWQTFAIIFLLF